MSHPDRLRGDQTIVLAAHGYEFITALRRKARSDVVDVRLFGQPVTCVGGSRAARLFYDEDKFERASATPQRIKKTLFGDNGVQQLDDATHRHRKAMFMSLTTAESLSSLAEVARVAWSQAVDRWTEVERIELFGQASQTLARAACVWAGVPIPVAEESVAARDLIAMVDGFGAVGPRHWRARSARVRAERWIETVVEKVRSGELPAPEASAARVVAEHRNLDGQLLKRRVAAVELLNILRPITAISWYVTFAAHALHHHPSWRVRLRSGADATARAFAHEVRRFYPFAPFLGARARRDFTWQGRRFPQGRLVLLDVHGVNHDPEIWSEPGRFDPGRFLEDPGRSPPSAPCGAAGRTGSPYEFIPQGGGDWDTGHRCAGEFITMELLTQASLLLAKLRYQVPPQDLSYPLRRIPTAPRSGFVMRQVRGVGAVTSVAAAAST